MKVKIQEALRNKYKNLGLDEKAFEGVADFAQTFIKEEDSIATFVDGAESMLKSIQSSTDRLRAEKSVLEKKLKELEEKTPEQKEDEGEEVKDTTPAWAKALVESNALLQKEIEGIRQNTTTKGLLENAKALFFTKELDPSRAKLAELAFRERTNNLTVDSKVEDVVEGVKTYYNELCSGTGVKGYIPKDASGGSESVDWSSTKKRLAERGLLKLEDSK